MTVDISNFTIATPLPISDTTDPLDGSVCIISDLSITHA